MAAHREVRPPRDVVPIRGSRRNLRIWLKRLLEIQKGEELKDGGSPGGSPSQRCGSDSGIEMQSNECG